MVKGILARNGRDRVGCSECSDALTAPASRATPFAMKIRTGVREFSRTDFQARAFPYSASKPPHAFSACGSL